MIDPSFFDEVDRLGGAYPGPASAGTDDGGHVADDGALRVLGASPRRAASWGWRRWPTTTTSGSSAAARLPLYNREVLAFLPFQVDDNRFVASVYVMTRDISAELAPAPYRLTISNLRGDDVQASAYDPLTDQEVPVQVVVQERRSRGDRDARQRLAEALDARGLRPAPDRARRSAAATRPVSAGLERPGGRARHRDGSSRYRAQAWRSPRLVLGKGRILVSGLAARPGGVA